MSMDNGGMPIDALLAHVPGETAQERSDRLMGRAEYKTAVYLGILRRAKLSDKDKGRSEGEGR